MKNTSTGYRGGRPMIMATGGVVSAGHYLATEVGMSVLRAGGNAMDAAAATGIALTVLKPHQNGIGGEMPTLFYSARQQKVWALSGHGAAPRGATLDHFHGLGLKLVPGDGLLPALVPPAIASWILLLRKYGTMRLADVLMPSIELAEKGVPMYDALHESIADSADRFTEQWPSSVKAFLPGGQVPAIGAIWGQEDWGRTFRQLAEAERKYPDRDAGLRAAHDAYYQGSIARTIVEFSQTQLVLDASGKAHHGLLTMEDFADYQARIEEPVTSSYRGIDVYKCPTWSQGPVLLQALNLLEEYDLTGMGHNTADYIHTVTECMKLAFADREFHYGDPLFVRVPIERLLSKEYAGERRKLVDPAAASMELRPDGYASIEARNVTEVNDALAGVVPSRPGDTTKLEVIDRAGNMVSVTTSGGWLMSSPVVPGLGFPLGTRGQMFSLVPSHPNCLAPGKRPRTTLTPSLATRRGKPWLVFGSPGGDSQDQWALQFFLNVVEFGMSLQEAVEAATFWSAHWPSSFYPRDAEPGALTVEGRVERDVCDELERRGHKLTIAADWAGGNTLAASIDPDTTLRCAAASPRLDPAYAAGY